MEYQKLWSMLKKEFSAEVRRMVEAARERQMKRFESTNIASNADKQMALTGILASWADALRFDHFSASNGLTPKPVDWHHNFNRTL